MLLTAKASCIFILSGTIFWLCRVAATTNHIDQIFRINTTQRNQTAPCCVIWFDQMRKEKQTSLLDLSIYLSISPSPYILIYLISCHDPCFVSVIIESVVIIIVNHVKTKQPGRVYSKKSCGRKARFVLLQVVLVDSESKTTAAQKTQNSSRYWLEREDGIVGCLVVKGKCCYSCA